MRSTFIAFAIVFIACAAVEVKFGDNPYYYKHWCGVESLRYLDDHFCNKKFPSNFTRLWRCPNAYSGEVPEGYYPDMDIGKVIVDTETLSSIPQVQHVNMAVILVRRHKNKAYFKYLGNKVYDEPIQPWSSSKPFAVANAASKLESQCGMSLDADTSGKHQETPLGDLMTIIASYDTTQGYTSNALGSYFLDIGGRQRAKWLIQKWLKRGDKESYGGNYGEPTPPDLGFQFKLEGHGMCYVNKFNTTPFQNSMSTFTLAEMVRRIALYEDLIPENVIPNVTLEDSRTMRYGAKTSKLFPGTQWGGMTADTSIFVQSGIDPAEIETRSEGQWRIFSKLGAGYSNTRFVGEIVDNSYSCFPVIKDGKVVPDKGVEFIISARSSVPKDTNLEYAQKVIQPAIAEVVNRIISGQLQ